MNFRILGPATGCVAGALGALILAAPALADPAAPVVPAPPPGEPTPVALPQGVPHLSSPQNLPPGTSEAPPPNELSGHRLSYLRDLWHAVRTQDVSMGDAILLFTQRPLDANATPPPGLAAGPQDPPPAPLPGPAPAPAAPPAQ